MENELARGLPRFLNRYLGSKFLKGNWDHKSNRTEVGVWYQQCYTLRNRVVHAGHLPTNEEAINCYEKTHNFVRSITTQVGGLKDKRLLPIISLLSQMQNVKPREEY
jgi:hypothetical protein